MSLKTIVKENPQLKKVIHWFIVKPGQARPRLWTRCLLRFFHTIKRGAVLRGRLDIFPFNQFYIGKNSILESNSVVNNGVGDVFIGENVTLGIGSVLIGPVHLGDSVIIAQHVVLSGLNHIYDRIDIPISLQGVRIKKIFIGPGSWVGANVTIAAGVTIGKNCVIGAGAVVTGDIPDHSVAFGNPARIFKTFCDKTQSWQRVSDNSIPN